MFNIIPVNHVVSQLVHNDNYPQVHLNLKKILLKGTVDVSLSGVWD